MDDKKYIYESPDRGMTVYRREVNTNVREEYKLWDQVKEAQDKLAYVTMWEEIHVMAKTNPTLKDALTQCELIYKLSKDHVQAK